MIKINTIRNIKIYYFSNYFQVYTKHRFVFFQADKLAAGLQELGMKAGDRFGLWSPNCTQWVVAMMAAARSGIISVSYDCCYNTCSLFNYNLRVYRIILSRFKNKNINFAGCIKSVIPQ